MANIKEYAYYVKGDKIAIVESSNSSSSGFTAVAHCTLGGYDTKDTCEAAGGQWIPSSGGSSIGSYKDYKSPIESITDGLEIEYAYNPKYTLGESELTPQINQFYINAWTVIDGYLTFLRSHQAAVPSWDSAPYSAVADDEYIVVRNSSRWNGLHKIKSGGTDGTLQTYTKVNQSVPTAIGSSNITIAAESSDKALVSAADSSNIWLNAIFSAGDYIFVSGSAQAVNNGLWKIHSVADQTSGENTSGVSVKNRYFSYHDSGAPDLSTEGEDTSPNTTGTSNESVKIYGAYRDFCYILADVNILNDESDTLPISEYLSKAVVYYVKAKLAEDTMDIEAKEYFMREFHRLIERYDASKVHTIRMVQTPSISIR